MKKILLGTVVAVALALPCLLVIRVSIAERAWSQTFGPLDQWPARIRTAGNDTAAMLPDWANRLVPNANSENKISAYHEGMDGLPSGLAQPSEFLQRYRREDFDAFAQWVAENPSPVFRYPLQSVDEPIPNVMSAMRIQKTLLAVAMARAAANDARGAERLLDASWRLNDSLRNRPILIEQLVSQAIFRYQLAALRKIDVDGAKWLPRIHAGDFVRTLAVSHQAEVWRIDRSVRENAYAAEDHLRAERTAYASLGSTIPYKPRWLQVLRTPVRWFNLPSALEAQRETLIVLNSALRSEHIDDDLNAAYARGLRRWWRLPDPDIPPKAWNSGKAVPPSFLRAVRVTAERELTEKIIAARTANRAAGGQWPSAIDCSSTLANARWIYETTPSGAVIRLSRPMEWGELSGFGLAVPLRYDLR